MKIMEYIISQEYLQSFQMKCREIVNCQTDLFSLLHISALNCTFSENVLINLLLLGQDVVPQYRSNIRFSIKLEPDKPAVAEHVLSR